MKQKTLKRSFTVTGKGLHTGAEIILTLNPAPEHFGVQIQRVDLEDKPMIKAIAENVNQTQRGTVVANKDGVQISTIEHVMACLYAAEIDNCLIETNAPEFPILDGSAKCFIDEIEKAGIVEQEPQRNCFYVKEKIEYVNEATGSKITLLPDDKFSVDVHIEFDSPVLNNQFASLSDLSLFKDEIAPCRTFVFVREIEALLKHNLIKGGDLDNALVIYDQEIGKEEFNHILEITNNTGTNLKVDKLGYINADLKFPNEPARHKLLDVIGDLSLIGYPIVGKVIATRPGHTVNTEFAKYLRKQIRKQEYQAPVYNPNKEPLYDLNGIKKILPHRWPFLLVDKIIEVGSDHIVGIKNVTFNETFFNGHFPEEPVMPGVLIVEAMAQTGGILALNSVDEPEKYSTYFLKLNEVRFRNKVVPGDTIIFKLWLAEPIRRGLVHMMAVAFVGDKIVTEADLMAQIVKNK